MSSYGAKLQLAFVFLGLVAVGVTGWLSSVTAANALRDATYERLTAVAETKRREVERYLQDAANHVLALSSDESAIRAVEEFDRAWTVVPPLRPGQNEPLRRLYSGLPLHWYPEDPRTQTLQTIFLANNPHPESSRHVLVNAPGAGKYSEVHARFHPTLNRYQSAFGFYDTLLIGARDNRILYTVAKEIDLAVSLRDPPYNTASLARLAERALELQKPETHVVEDYEPYLPSKSAPAAFFGAPVWRDGVKIGVLVIQISSDELNRVMTSDGRWREEGLGKTGQAYIVGPDKRLRSNLRSGDKLAMLNVMVPREIAASIQSGERSTHLGRDFTGVPVLRSHTPISVAGLNWTLIAEIEAAEALKPVADLRLKVLLWGVAIGLVIFGVATLLARSVTRPVLALSKSADRIGRGDFEARLPVKSNDELGRLAASFNQMAEDLRRTTVSKEELEVLAGRLISSQEDERTRIARELHDDLSERLAGTALEIGRLQRSDPNQHEELANLKDQVVELSEDIQELSRRLHDSSLDDTGLVTAVEAQCQRFFEKGGPPVAFTSEGEFETVNHDVQLALYRIVQEALKNVQRHSGADDVSIRLRRTPHHVDLEVRDNGCGFDLRHRRWQRGVGLASMKERANLLGGRCTIESKPAEGARIVVSMPL